MMKIFLTFCYFILFASMTFAQTSQPGPPMPATPTPPVPPEGLDFVWWQDPNEGAFAMQIPQGWQTQGGMLDVFGTKSLSMNIISPDNANYIGIGTVPTEWGIILTPELEALGWQNQQMVAGDTGLFIAVDEFRTGAKVAQLYADRRVQPNCESYEITEANDYKREEIDGIIYSAGEVFFKCDLNGTTFSGYYYALTIAYPIEGVGTVWTIDNFYTILALPNNFPLAINTLIYMLETLRYNPEWVDALTPPEPEDYAVLQEQIEGDALLNDVVSQIIGLSYQRTQTIIAEHNAMVDLDYEFLPLP